jgi:hypothetical protein
VFPPAPNRKNLGAALDLRCGNYPHSLHSPPSKRYGTFCEHSDGLIFNPPTATGKGRAGVFITHRVFVPRRRAQESAVVALFIRRTVLELLHCFYMAGPLSTVHVCTRASGGKALKQAPRGRQSEKLRLSPSSHGSPLPTPPPLLSPSLSRPPPCYQLQQWALATRETEDRICSTLCVYIFRV